MSQSAFQRAREPEQKEQRRHELLTAAGELLRAGGVEAVSLSAIARTAGLAKSNVYRYFESREQILLEILIEDELRWVAELELALAPLAGRDEIDEVARLVAQTIAARPLTCQLISVVAAVLEHNLSTETIAAFKTRVLEVSIRVRNALLAALPGLPHQPTEALVRYLHALIAGLWPMAHPAPSAVAALERTEFRGLCSEFATDLAGAFAAMLRGLRAA